MADARVVEYVRAYAKVCLSVSKLETFLRDHVEFRSTNHVEVLIIAGSVADACVVEYVLVPVSVSNLETLLRGDVDFRSTNEAEYRRFPF